MLPGGVWWTILHYLDSNDLITLLYTSRCLRFFVLIKFKSYWKLRSGFCSFDQWNEKLNQIFFNLLNKLYLDLDNCVFDFEYYILKLRKVKCHLSLFSICIHYMRCTRSCNKLPKSRYWLVLLFTCKNVKILICHLIFTILTWIRTIILKI